MIKRIIRRGGQRVSAPGRPSKTPLPIPLVAAATIVPSATDSAGVVPTISEQLANSRRIAGDNADLFTIAAGALAEVRELRQQWNKLALEIEGAAKADALLYCEGDIEAIIDRYDAAITEAIK